MMRDGASRPILSREAIGRTGLSQAQIHVIDDLWLKCADIPIQDDEDKRELIRALVEEVEGREDLDDLVKALAGDSRVDAMTRVVLKRANAKRLAAEELRLSQLELERFEASLALEDNPLFGRF